MTIKELAELFRRGEATEGPLADFAADYEQASKVFRKKDD